MAGLFIDIRSGWRLHMRRPVFAAATVAMLGTAIGAASAVFSLVQAVILRDLPFAEPERLVWMYNARTERHRAPFSIPDLNDYRTANTTLTGIAVFTNWTANLTGPGDAERLEGTRVSGDFFPLLGSQPLLGRAIEPRDEASAERVVVLTHGVWTRRFGGDPAVVGSRILLNGAAYAVIGVMPSAFVFPFRDAEVAVPLSLRDDVRRSDRGANFLRVVARLRPQATIAQAKVDLDTIAHRLQRQYPIDDARKTGVNLYPLHAEIISDYREILWTLFAAVIVVVAIGCGNLATLLLLRAAARTPELALRLSLGARPGRLMRQLIIEAGLLAAGGGVLGVCVALAAISSWRAFGPTGFPRAAEIAIDGYVLTFTLVLSAAVTLVCGAVPGWMAVHNVADTIRRATRTLTGSRRDGRVRRAFVVVQIGGAAVLLVCMGLVARAFSRLEQVDPGFTPDHALTVQLSLPPARYGGRDAILRLYDTLRVQLDDVNGVRAVGAVSLLPLSGLLSIMDIAFPDRPAPPPDEVPQAHYRIASAGYFSAAGIGIIDGREFTGADNLQGAPVAIVSRSLAERYWPGERAVGKYLQTVQGSAPARPAQVVGVVKDVKQFTVDGAATADLYVPLEQAPASQASALAARMYLVVRTDLDPRQVVANVRRVVRAVDPDIAASSVRSLDEVLAASLGGRRAGVRLLETFGEVALLLAAIGVYAIVAFAADARTREMAIRSAFGASRRDLVSLVVATELRSVCVGIAGGLAAALVVARSLGSALYSVSASDPGTYIAVALLLFGVTFVAAWLPAMRAGRVDPAELLRS
jgi:putative ABC transport system permease protein